MKKRRPLSKRMAKKIAAGILSLEQLDIQVLNQFDANQHLAAFVQDPADRRMVMDAAEEFAQKMYELAGDEVMVRITSPPVAAFAMLQAQFEKHRRLTLAPRKKRER